MKTSFLTAALLLACSFGIGLADQVYVKSLLASRLQPSLATGEAAAQLAGFGAKDVEGWWPQPPSKEQNKKLFDAVKHGDLATVKVSIMYGADVNAIMKGKSALMIACAKGFEDIALELLRGGAMLDLTDKKGDTALITAVRKEQFGMVVVLVVLGADVNHVDNKGRNALSLAKEKGFDDIAHFLKNHGAIDPTRSFHKQR